MSAGTIRPQESAMPDHTYKLVELVGTSQEGINQAIQNGIERAAKTLKGLDWFEVVAVRGQIVEGEVKYYQVDMKVGFRVMEPEDLRA
jgi:flavin-binding protein dodecin